MKYLFALIILVTSVSAHSGGYTGYDLMEQCRATSVGEKDFAKLSVSNFGAFIQGIACLYYISWFAEAAKIESVDVTDPEYKNEVFHGLLHSLCILEDTKRFVLAKVYLNWADKHPEDLHILAYMSLFKAFSAAYSCSK